MFAEGPWKYVLHILFVSDTWHNNHYHPLLFQLGGTRYLDTSLEDCQAAAGAYQRSQHNTQEQTIVGLVGHFNGVTCTTGGLCCFAMLLDR